MTWRRRVLWVWAALSLAWIAGVVYVCMAAWPSMPLDLGDDAAARAALARAVMTHAIRCTVLALGPALLLLALGWLGSRLIASLRSGSA